LCRGQVSLRRGQLQLQIIRLQHDQGLSLFNVLTLFDEHIGHTSGLRECK